MNRSGLFIAARNRILSCRFLVTARFKEIVVKKRLMPLTQRCGKILDGVYAESKQVLLQHRDQLDLVAGELLKYETLDAQMFKRLIKQPAVAA